jgi:hypothetical protein
MLDKMAARKLRLKNKKKPLQTDEQRKKVLLSNAEKLPELALENNNTEQLIEKAMEIVNDSKIISGLQIKNGEQQIDVNQKITNE